MSVNLYNPHAVGRDEIGGEKAKEKISHRFRLCQSIRVVLGRLTSLMSLKKSKQSSFAFLSSFSFCFRISAWVRKAFEPPPPAEADADLREAEGVEVGMGRAEGRIGAYIGLTEERGTLHKLVSLLLRQGKRRRSKNAPWLWTWTWVSARLLHRKGRTARQIEKQQQLEHT
jgi:hypothetical protein